MVFMILPLANQAENYINFLGSSTMVIKSGATMTVGNFTTVSTSQITNYGTLEIKGNLTNNSIAMFDTTSTGTVTFNGSVAQEITGEASTTFYGTVDINNSYLCAIWLKDMFRLYLYFDVLFYNVSIDSFSMEMLEGRA